MGKVVSVAAYGEHQFSKTPCDEIHLTAGFGVEGDCHYGEKVQHRSRVAKNPDQPNLRQVHLIHEELFNELATQGFHVQAGEMGENILTRNIALLDLPQKTRLYIGEDVMLELTGLRNPCKQIDAFQSGLMHALIDKDTQGNLIRKAGVMSVVVQGGVVRPDDRITIALPDGKHNPLEPV